MLYKIEKKSKGKEQSKNYKYFSYSLKLNK